VTRSRIIIPDTYAVHNTSVSTHTRINHTITAALRSLVIVSDICSKSSTIQLDDIACLCTITAALRSFVIAVNADALVIASCELCVAAASFVAVDSCINIQTHSAIRNAALREHLCNVAAFANQRF
jgi:hypothetical protein